MASAVSKKTERIELLDWLRGVALIAMAIFHFAFDLEMFGVVEPGYTVQPHWKYFARAIASSFLFLVGFSLFLAHSEGIRWRAFSIRFAKVAGAAALITIVTWFATPDVFIFFGILHSIALASLLGLAFLRFSWWGVALAAVAVFTLRAFGRTPMLDAPVWWWSGLSEISPRASDYVPIFPWFGAVLLGIAAAKLARNRQWLPEIARFEMDNAPGRLLKFIGRHSLVFYLLHQPVMIALLYGFLKFTGYI